MNTLTLGAGIGPLAVAAACQVGGILVGALLREAVRGGAGDDPRRGRLWAAELIVVAIFAGVLGYLFAIAADVTLVGPPFGAALTVYAALSGVHAFLGAREANLRGAARWAAAHVVACVLVGMLGFAVVLLIAGIGTR